MSLVELQDVVKRYGAHTVLDGVSLAVEKGEIIAIIGRSGSGKSTLLRCVNGLEPIQGGTVRFEGTVVNDPATDLRKLRQHVGIVFQSFNLFPHLSVEKNITLAPKVVKGVPAGEARRCERASRYRLTANPRVPRYPRRVFLSGLSISPRPIGYAQLAMAHTTGDPHAGQPVLSRGPRPADARLTEANAKPINKGSQWGNLVAYTKICSHAGCPASLYEQQTNRLLCPCHQSQFQITDNARPVFGPASRALAQLPIDVDGEGYLYARSDYPVPVGPAFWERP